MSEPRRTSCSNVQPGIIRLEPVPSSARVDEQTRAGRLSPESRECLGEESTLAKGKT